MSAKCGAWDNCDLPAGHNIGKADIAANHAAAVDDKTEWAVIDGDNLEQWPAEDTAREEMRLFYSDEARLVSRTVTDWVDVDGNS